VSIFRGYALNGMKLPSSFLSSILLCLLVFLLSGQSALVQASEPKKQEPAKEEKKLRYVEEEGEEARGYTYKRVAKDPFEEPKPVPKEEPKPPPKAEPKDPHAKPDAHGKPEEKKKDDGHGDGHDAKKEEKKKDDKKKNDGHGKESKKEAPVLSQLYTTDIIKLDVNNRPFTAIARSTKMADYYLCRDVVTTKYKTIVFNEMNTFADRMGLPRAQDKPCMVKIAKPNTKFPGAVYIEFYPNQKAAVACMHLGECGATRLVMLFPKDKTGKHSQDIYRSYVLTDENKYQRGAFCVSPQGQLLGEKNCYVALNPDWLFN